MSGCQLLYFPPGLILAWRSPGEGMMSSRNPICAEACVDGEQHWSGL